MERKGQEGISWESAEQQFLSYIQQKQQQLIIIIIIIITRTTTTTTLPLSTLLASLPRCLSEIHSQNLQRSEVLLFFS